jgi:hypothetical protein
MDISKWIWFKANVDGVLSRPGYLIADPDSVIWFRGDHKFGYDSSYIIFEKKPPGEARVHAVGLGTDMTYYGKQCTCTPVNTEDVPEEYVAIFKRWLKRNK